MVGSNSRMSSASAPVIVPLFALVSAAQAELQPHSLGAPATVEGSKMTVTRLLNATRAKDDVSFEKIARGLVIMLAPDFGVPVSRAKFEEAFKDCTNQQVVSSDPFPKMPEAQVVRVTMQCQPEQHPKPIDVVADFMADDEHVFGVFPGGVSRIWPPKQ